MREIPKELTPYLLVGETLWAQPACDPSEEYQEDYPQAEWAAQEVAHKRPQPNSVTVKTLEPVQQRQQRHSMMMMGVFGMPAQPAHPRAFLVTVVDNGSVVHWMTDDVTEACAAAKVFWSELC